MSPEGTEQWVDQVVFGFARTIGGREMGVCASSFPSGSAGPGMWHERVKEYFRLGADRSGSTAYAPVLALSYLEFGDGTGAVLRRVASGDLGRNVSHALVGPAADLAPLALYLDDWSGWRGRPPQGQMEPVPLSELIALVQRTAAALDREAAAHAAHAVPVVRALLDGPGSGVTVVNVGSAPPLPLLRIIRRVLDPLLNRSTPAVRWTFSTFELTDERSRRDLPTFVFLPSTPFAGETTHMRVYLDDLLPADEHTRLARALVDDYVHGTRTVEPAALPAAFPAAFHLTPPATVPDGSEQIAQAGARRVGSPARPAAATRRPAGPSTVAPARPSSGNETATDPVPAVRADAFDEGGGAHLAVGSSTDAPVGESRALAEEIELGSSGNTEADDDGEPDLRAAHGAPDGGPEPSWAMGAALRHADDTKLLERAAAAPDMAVLTAALDEMRRRIGSSRARERVVLRERLRTLDLLVPALESTGIAMVERADAFRTLLEFVYGPDCRDLASPAAAAVLAGLLARPDTEPSLVHVAHGLAVRHGAGPVVDAALGRRWRIEHPPPSDLDLELPPAGRSEVLHAIAARLHAHKTALVVVVLLAVLLLIVGIVVGGAL